MSTPTNLRTTFALLGVSALAACASTHHEFGLDQAALDQPQLIGEGVISDGMDQRDCALSFDGEHLLYTLQMGRDAL